MKTLLLPIALLTICLPLSAQSPRYARVISQEANLRDAPSVTGESSEVIAEDTLVKVLDEKLPWYVVRLGNRVGWMHGNTIEFVRGQAPFSGSSTNHSVVPDSPPVFPPVQHRSTLPARPARSTPTDQGYIRGPRGGCYYISASGRKVYVDRSLCN
jgi:hypothetical protein